MRNIFLSLLIFCLGLPVFGNNIIIPEPKQMSVSEGSLEIQGELQIQKSFSPEARPLSMAARELQGLLKIPSNEKDTVMLHLASMESGSQLQINRLIRQFNLTTPEKEEGYVLKVTPDAIVILGADDRGLFYGIQTLKQLVKVKEHSFSVPCVEISDFPSLSFRGIHFLTGKNALREQKQLVDFMANHKMNHIVMQVEHLEYESCPEIFHPEQGQTKDEVRELISYARDHYITITPLVASLGHARWAFYNDQNLDISEDPDLPEAFDVTNPRTYQFLFQIYDEVLELFEPEYFHIGLDEVDHFGHYPFREETKKYSMTEILDLYFRRLEPYFEQNGIDKVMIWGDMFLARGEDAPDAAFAETVRDARARRAILHNAMRKGIPEEFIICDWHYGPFSPESFTSLEIFHDLGLKTIASTWNNPGNIRNFVRKAIEEKSLGHLQTTWAGFNFFMEENVDCHPQFAAYLLAADYSWSGRDEFPNMLPYDFQTEFWKRWYMPESLFGNAVKISKLSSLNVIKGLVSREMEVDLVPVINEKNIKQTDNFDYELTVKYSNPFDVAMKTLIDIGKPLSFQKELTVAAGTPEKSLDFPFSYPAQKITPQSEVDVRFTICLDELESFEVERKGSISPVWQAQELPGEIEIDGNLSEWKAVSPYIYDSSEFISNKTGWITEDITAGMYLGHYNGDLNLAFEVNDNIHFQDKVEGSIWEGDCIQMAFDFYSDRTPYYNANDLEIGFALNNEGEKQIFCWLSHFSGENDPLEITEYEIQRKGKTTIYEIKIPLSKLGDPKITAADTFGFTFTINDNDGEKFNGGIIGSRGIWGDKRPDQFGTLVLH